MLIRFPLYAFLCLVLTFGASACVGTAIEVATDTAIAVGKVPFKLGGAVVDVATGGDEEEDEKQSEKQDP